MLLIKMANHKLILDDTLDEDFSLIAIHCSEESFKLAYLLNAYGHLKLKRCNEDIFYTTKDIKACFPLFHFSDVNKCIDYYLVTNKSRTQQIQTQKNNTLFSSLIQEQIVMTQLIAEHKKVDYFLKIQNDYKGENLKKLMAPINEIKQVISAYEIDISTLKSKDNLIFN